MEKWTINNIPDLSGKTIIVTGANVGLGFEAVKMLSRKNAEVILASRSILRGDEAKRKILNEVPNADIHVMKLDLADLKSIRDFAKEFNKDFEKLDVLLNNAGVMWCPYDKTKDGFELQMGVNHFGHFALTGLLLESLKKAKGSRIVTVSSLGHRRAKLDLNKPMFNENDYDRNVAYFNSKLSNLLFTYELQRKFEEHNLDITSIAAHPGGSATDLSRHVEQNAWFRLLKPLFYLVAQSAEKGTLPEVRASVDAEVNGGEYYGPRGFNEMGGYPVLVKSTEDSYNLESAKRLWEISEDLTGIKYSFN
jgi:NAD(P)-dependent dehydrogenase (short-subunit alcohol dehydrogenase family)